MGCSLTLRLHRGWELGLENLLRHLTILSRSPSGSMIVAHLTSGGLIVGNSRPTHVHGVRIFSWCEDFSGRRPAVRHRLLLVWHWWWRRWRQVGMRSFPVVVCALSIGVAVLYLWRSWRWRVVARLWCIAATNHATVLFLRAGRTKLEVCVAALQIHAASLAISEDWLTFVAFLGAVVVWTEPGRTHWCSRRHGCRWRRTRACIWCMCRADHTLMVLLGAWRTELEIFVAALQGNSAIPALPGDRITLHALVGGVVQAAEARRTIWRGTLWRCFVVTVISLRRLHLVFQSLGWAEAESQLDVGCHDIHGTHP